MGGTASQGNRRALGTGGRALMERAALGSLFDALRKREYRVIGPTVRDGAVVYDELDGPEALPAGWGDEQAPGRYRLFRREHDTLFGYTLSPQSWKRWLYPPVATVCRVDRSGRAPAFTGGGAPREKLAFLGVRACELQAIAVQDRILLEGTWADPQYAARRQSACLIAVNCTQSGGTCFCASVQSGPAATTGFDLALTELCDAQRHEFLIEVGTARGGELLAELAHRPADPETVARATSAVAETAARMGRTLEVDGLKDLLYRHLDHPRWDQVASRCLACANCTMVCPTCFCSTVEEVTDLTGTTAERVRKWDSCFTMAFSYIHGGSIRSSTRARYRQWLTHKLATWVDQFGTLGCVGCGRCISWCPVGIDVTEEVREIRESERCDPPATPGGS
ncbi:MAG TPA: 4Fe-4S dicluster domain-containing protein [bacterium]